MGTTKAWQKRGCKNYEGKLRQEYVGVCGRRSWKAVGFARVQLWDGAYFVREVFVAKPLRRKGVGSKLLAKCEDLVGKNGETSIYLTVEPKHSVSMNFLIHNGYDTLNMLELRKDFVQADFLKREGVVEVLGHKLRLIKRKI